MTHLNWRVYFLSKHKIFKFIIINVIIVFIPLTKNEISDMILAAFPDATLELKDTMGDNNHFEAKIISKNFVGKSKIEQHNEEGFASPRRQAISLALLLSCSRSISLPSSLSRNCRA